MVAIIMSLLIKDRTIGRLRFITFHFIALFKYCAFYKLKVCGNLALSKSVGTIFPTAFAHFLSLCHILVILTIFQTFSLLLYLLWSSVVFDVTIAKRLQLAKGSDDG